MNTTGLTNGTNTDQYPRTDGNVRRYHCKPPLLLRACLFASLLILLLLPFSFTAQQQTSQPADAITGRVVTPDGQPLARVAVFARPVGAMTAAGRVNAVTDEAGRFTLRDLDHGAYILTTFSRGYAPMHAASHERNAARDYHRPGDFVTLTMTKGGVITGRVTNKAGEPLVRISVRAVMRRTPDGEEVTRSSPYFYTPDKLTDDRGIYRIYGLPAGIYVVTAGASRQNYSPLPDAYGGLVATYHPSATSEAATEVTVASGTEATNIDIAFRGEQGRTVTGSVAGAIGNSAREIGIQVSLVNAASGFLEHSSYVTGRAGARGFSFDGVSAGEYDIIARRSSWDNQPGAASLPQRISVRATNITGIELALLPLAIISGRIRIEPLAETLRANELCRSAQNANATIEYVVVAASRSDAKTINPTANLFSTKRDAVPDARGEFTLRDLDAGDYRLEPLTPNENLYVRSIAVREAPTNTSGAKPVTHAKSPTALINQPTMNADPMTIKSGEQLSDIEITLAEGAARLQGRIVNVKEDSALQSRLRIYLVPVEAEHAAHSWRYHTTLVAPDNTWTLTRLAPGAYRILALKADPNSTARQNSDARGRIELRRLAEATGTRVELASCQSMTDFVLR